jgi:uncharacterized protein (TIGR03437 family)
MKRILLLCQSLLLCLSLFPGAGKAAINTGGIVNVASYALSGLPGSEIAQGSIFAVFGSNLGPAALVQDPDFPLGTSLGGTSITVTVGSTTVNCLLIYTIAGQVAALLPSNTPVGTGTLRLTFNGQTFSEPIKVAKAAVGIFAQTAAGVGAAVLQIFDPAGPPTLNTLNNSIHSGEYGILWVTGLGGVAGDESAGPLPDIKPGYTTLRIFVGGVEVPTNPLPGGDFFYAGRSGCCAGQDQIIFKIPAGISGCYVPVVVVVDGIASNYLTISISPQGSRVCSIQNGLSTEELQTILSKAAVRSGYISLSRTTLKLSAGGFDLDTTTDGGFASFQSVPVQGYSQSVGSLDFLTVGSCFVYQAQAGQQGYTSPVTVTQLDAGNPLAVQGPKGNKQLPRVAGGSYSATFATSSSGIPGGPPSDPPYLDPGAYTITGPGGADVGAFNTNLTLPPLLTWTNRDQINNIPRSTGLNVTWTGGSQNDEVVQILGISSIGEGLNAKTVVFYCLANVQPPQFTVPASVLSALPPSTSIAGTPNGILQVGSSSKPKRFNAPNLDYGFIGYQILNLKNVNYQ